MGARHKLNSAAVNGALIIGGLVGAISGSWLVFGVCAAVLVATSIYNGNIRGRRRNR
jgi:hypothetical protein